MHADVRLCACVKCYRHKNQLAVSIASTQQSNRPHALPHESVAIGQTKVWRVEPLNNKSAAHCAQCTVLIEKLRQLNFNKQQKRPRRANT